MMKRFFALVLMLCLLAPCALAEEPAAVPCETLTNTQLGIKLQYPTGWVSNPGTATICFLESVSMAGVPGRMAVTVKPVKATPTSKEMEDQLSTLSTAVSTQYSNFNITEMTSDARFMNTRAYALRYTADSEQGEVSGFITITHISKKIYAFHYSCATENFTASSAMIQTLRDSVALINAN